MGALPPHGVCLLPFFGFTIPAALAFMQTLPTSASSSATLHEASELRVTRVRALRGPNYWRLSPVVACDLALGSLDHVSTAELHGFADRLVAALPSLVEHKCSLGHRGGFFERLREGTYLPHVLEHLALELQRRAGSDVHFGRVVPSGDQGVWWVIAAYEDEEVGVRAMHEAVQLIRACIADEPFDVEALTEELCNLREDVRLGPSTQAIVDEAQRRGIPVHRLNSHSLVRLGMGRNLRRIQATMSDFTSGIAVEIAQNKDDTKRALDLVGLPVPSGKVAGSLTEALEVAHDIGFPVILKPLDANHGRGISPRLDDEAALRAAWPLTSTVSRRAVVEKFAVGRDHRALVVNGKLVACAERVPAHVMGDGTHPIRALIDTANADPRRGVGHRNILTKLLIDDETERYLGKRGFTYDSVPLAGERVVLRPTANLSTGGTSIDRTDEMHPENIMACETAANIIGLDIAGIDIISGDIAVPFRENGGVIIEVNAAPGLRMHTHPAEGAPRNVGAAIIDMLYPPGTKPDIPVIAVTGTNGKTTTTRLIAHLFGRTGRRVGFTTTDGVYIDNRRVMTGDMTGPFSANIVLSNPTVDVAVLETARGGILRAGLGFDECDVGIVLNVTSDHLGLGGIHTLHQLAQVKGVIPAVVKRDGAAILNADDPLVLGMQERVTGDIVLFSLQPDGRNPEFEEHLERNGVGARIENNSFVIRRGRVRIPIAAQHEVPLMMGGAAHFQRQNILAAILAAYVQGVRYDEIRSGLLTFFPSPVTTPGRLNLIRVGDGSALIDYAHNAAAVSGLLDFAMRLPAARRIGVVASPGDRRDEDIRNLGRLTSALDYVIVREDADRRGRPAGEAASLLREGLRDGGMKEDHIEIVFEEAEAVDRAASLIGEGDLAIILADHVEHVVKRLGASLG
ncbi:MAG: cyanophycin synthetase [Gemmatimonadetes bacterium]|nr:cyanophycin synthetase [Gemmatimonadota bacterium]